MCPASIARRSSVPPCTRIKQSARRRTPFMFFNRCQLAGTVIMNRSQIGHLPGVFSAAVGWSDTDQRILFDPFGTSAAIS